jgi:excinuclease UvrABC ATPase subunit
VVDHKPSVITIADHVTDMGPGAGVRGGEVVYAGDVAGLRQSGTVTGKYLVRRHLLKPAVRTPTGELRITGANLHNLRDVEVAVPTGVLTVVTCWTSRPAGCRAGPGAEFSDRGLPGPACGVI